MINYFQTFKTKSFFFLIIAAAVLSACNSSHKRSQNTYIDTAATADNENSEGWVSLFDGNTFAGWHTYGTDSVSEAWKVEDSVIHLHSLVKKGWQTLGGGDLTTNEEYSNFDLRMEWKISTAGNSGIFIYVHEDPTKFKNPNESGLEMQINDDPNTKNGKIEKLRAGDLVGLLSSSSAKVLKPAGQWNLSEIRANRGKLNFFINGIHTLFTTLWDDNWQELIENSKFKKMDGYGTFKKGKIVLQDHGSDVWFRNIMIKKL